MKTYKQFHGDIQITEIGKELRRIATIEKSNFKILTGYGSTTGASQSKHAALRSLSKMKKQGIIKGYLPGEVKHLLLPDSSPYYHTKLDYESILKSDSDFRNEGIIFVFIK